MTKEMELAKRIYNAWHEHAVLSEKQAALVAARVALGKSEEGRDLIFEALCSAMGADWNEMPKSEQSRYNVAAKQLREVCVDPSEILRRAKRYEFLHPKWELTPTSLITHWSSLSGRTTPEQPRQIFAEPELEVELVGPPADFKLPDMRRVDL